MSAERGGNLYFPLPYAGSLKITIEEKDKPVSLYYEIGYRTYPARNPRRDVRSRIRRRIVGGSANPDCARAFQPEARAGTRGIAEWLYLPPDDSARRVAE